MEKRYYWLKLKEDFFDEDVINWLEEQENGKDYCLFYLKLCLKSLKTDGVLIRSVGDFLIPYDAKKLSEITRTDIDTVRVAMKVLGEIGLIQILENGEIYLTQIEKMVGSETNKAESMRKLRAKRKEGNIVTKMLPRDRDKSIDIDIDIDKKENINISNDIFIKEKREIFKKPTLEEVKKYCEERNNNIDAQYFIDFYESKNWMIGKNKMKDWKACVRTWEKNNNKSKNNNREASTPEWFYKDLDKEEENDEGFEDFLRAVQGNNK